MYFKSYSSIVYSCHPKKQLIKINKNILKICFFLNKSVHLYTGKHLLFTL